MKKGDAELFVEKNRIFIRLKGVKHRDQEYDQQGFHTLLKMQRKHFWYLGRHKFLLHALRQELLKNGRQVESLSAIDLGGGCGGWVEFLHKHLSAQFKEIALGDSSLTALNLASPVVSSFANRYQIDLLDLGWTERWDVIFLLDVLEHIPDHVRVLEQIKHSLRSGGILFITAPALQFFWSYNDLFAKHQRRYSRSDHIRLADETGLNLLWSRYFMFFLSPFLYISRLVSPNVKTMGEEQIHKHLQKTHRILSWPVNKIFTSIFSLEANIGLRYPLPWGTSILAVYKKI